MNDISLAETVVIAMRIATMKEMMHNAEVDKPTLQTVLEIEGERVGNQLRIRVWMIYNRTYEGADLIAELTWNDPMDTEAQRSLARAQTGVRATSGYFPQQIQGQRLKKSLARRVRLPSLRGRRTGIDQSRGTTGISMETLHQQLLLQRLLKKVEEGPAWFWFTKRHSSAHAKTTKQHVYFSSSVQQE